jgi:hypothetical protein
MYILVVQHVYPLKYAFLYVTVGQIKLRRFRWSGFGALLMSTRKTSPVLPPLTSLLIDATEGRGFLIEVTRSSPHCPQVSAVTSYKKVISRSSLVFPVHDTAI